jgi:cytochrome P450
MNVQSSLADIKLDCRGIQKIRQGVLYDFLGSGIFTTDGTFWQHSRAMLRPQFEKSQVSVIEQFEPYVQKLMSCIPTDGSTVDLQELFHKLTMDTSTDFLTGTGTDCLGGDKEADKFAHTYEKCLSDGIWKDMLGPLWYLTPRKEGAEAIKYAHSAVEGWVKQAMQIKTSAGSSEKVKGRGERYVFVNELARHEEVDATRIRDETLNILLAGRDTTASLLSNLWFVLAKEPEIYKKLQAEVNELNDKPPSYESLRNMKYIKYTVQECKNPTIRYHQATYFH